MALSGGVDSAVAAFLLQQRGYTVRGAFMRPWDDDDDEYDDDDHGGGDRLHRRLRRHSNGNAVGCAWKQDYHAALRVAEHLRLADLQLVDLTREYWTSVFVPHLLDAYQAGRTPNPDLACNRYIKFGAFAERVGRPFATGHYARRRGLQLLRAADEAKDQTYFLASTPREALADVHFPLGDVCKTRVREIARAIGLPNAARRSSRGICFVDSGAAAAAAAAAASRSSSSSSRSPLSAFINRYIEPALPEFELIDVDTGRCVGRAPSCATLGQRARVGGARAPYYVCDKDVEAQRLYVCAGRHHRMLYCARFVVEPFFDAGIASDRRYLYRTWHRQALAPCTVSEDNRVVTPSAAGAAPARITAPGQALALYDGEVCVGGGIVKRIIR